MDPITFKHLTSKQLKQIIKHYNLSHHIPLSKIVDGKRKRLSKDELAEELDKHLIIDNDTIRRKEINYMYDMPKIQQKKESNKKKPIEEAVKEYKVLWQRTAPNAMQRKEEIINEYNDQIIKYLEKEMEEPRMIRDKIKNELDKISEKIDKLNEMRKTKKILSNIEKLKSRGEELAGERKKAENIIFPNYRIINELKKKLNQTSDVNKKEEEPKISFKEALHYYNQYWDTIHPPAVKKRNIYIKQHGKKILENLQNQLKKEPIKELDEANNKLKDYITEYADIEEKKTRAAIARKKELKNMIEDKQIEIKRMDQTIFPLLLKIGFLEKIILEK